MILDKGHIGTMVKKFSLILFVIVSGVFFFAGSGLTSLIAEFNLDHEIELSEVLAENDLDEKEGAEELDNFPKVFHNDTDDNGQTLKDKSFLGAFGFYTISHNDAYEVPHPPPDRGA